MRITNKSNGVAKIDLRVPAGASIDTDDEDVIAQLLANSEFVRSERARQNAKADAAVEEAGGGSARRSSGRRS